MHFAIPFLTMVLLYAIFINIFRHGTIPVGMDARDVYILSSRVFLVRYLVGEVSLLIKSYSKQTTTIPR